MSGGAVANQCLQGFYDFVAVALPVATRGKRWRSGDRPVMGKVESWGVRVEGGLSLLRQKHYGGQGNIFAREGVFKVRRTSKWDKCERGAAGADGLVRKAGNPGRQELGNLKLQTSKLQGKGAEGVKLLKGGPMASGTP